MLREMQVRGVRPGFRRDVQLRLLPGLIAVCCACGSEAGPTGPPPPTSALRYSTISAGYFHTCGLALTGTAYCWGGNGFGTLGDGTREQRRLPTAVAGGHAFDRLDAGAGHNCALSPAGDAWCWGQNDEGQLGDGTFAPRDVPVRVVGGHAFATISAGHAHSCGLTAQGVAWCWGDDSSGQLGNGADGVMKSATPVRVVSTEPFETVIAGYYQTCALTSSGAGWCWGRNDAGQDGDGTTGSRPSPVRVLGGHSFSAIGPGDRFVCGVSDGATFCWGANRNGELGDDGPAMSSVPIQLAGTAPFGSVVASSGASTIPTAESFACGVAASGVATCWGGAIRTLRAAGAGVRQLDSRIRFSELTAGGQHICGLSRDGYAYCGGANYSGQLGDGTSTDRTEMVAIPGPAGS